MCGPLLRRGDRLEKARLVKGANESCYGFQVRARHPLLALHAALDMQVQVAQRTSSRH